MPADDSSNQQRTTHILEALLRLGHVTVDDLAAHFVPSLLRVPWAKAWTPAPRAARGRSLVAVALLAASLAASSDARAQTFAIHDGDRVVFYGDSITEQHVYTDFVETYVVTRFPSMRVDFVDAGWSGEWVVGGGGGKADERLRRDVIARRPSVVVVMLGMNDAAYRSFDKEFFDVYTAGYRHLVDTLLAALPGLRITLLRPSPFDEITETSEYRPVPPTIEGGYNPVLVRYGEFVADLARERKLTVVDANGPVVDALRRATKEDADAAGSFIPDRIHPGSPAGLLMAAGVLEAWHAPAIVTEVEIDARSAKVVAAANTTVSALVSGEALSWSQRDRALPFPIDLKDKPVALAARLGDVGARLSRQPLRVIGLRAPRYTLTIDGVVVGSFRREELERGIDLASLPTPMLEQAVAVHALTSEHNEVHLFRWQRVQVGLLGRAPREASRALQSLDALEARLVAQQRAAATPRPRRYELRPGPGR